MNAGPTVTLLLQAALGGAVIAAIALPVALLIRRREPSAVVMRKPVAPPPGRDTAAPAMESRQAQPLELPAQDVSFSTWVAARTDRTTTDLPPDADSDEMGLAPVAVNRTKAMLYAAFGAMSAAAMATLVLSNTFEIAGVAMAALATGFAIAMCFYLASRHARHTGGRFVDATLHPNRGVFATVASTWPARLGNALVGVVSMAAAADLMLRAVPGAPPDSVASQRTVGAALLLFMGAAATAELVLSIVVHRWGKTPPIKVQIRLMVALATGGLLIGVPASLFAMDYLHSQGIVETWGLLFVVPAMVGAVVLYTWFRNIYVSRWVARLAEQTARAEQAETGRKLAEAQLAILQAQIEPHFLYNTLASVQYLVRRDANSADFLLTQLVRYLRHAMPKLRQRMSTLHQEFELADAYLQIARMRMGGRLGVELELDAALHDIAFPPLVLQTLVENAVKHGIEPKPGPAQISVTARYENDLLVIEVADNGVGLHHGARTAGTGTGLMNIRERLNGIYGSRARLGVETNGCGGVTSIVALSTCPQSAL